MVAVERKRGRFVDREIEERLAAEDPFLSPILLYYSSSSTTTTTLLIFLIIKSLLFIQVQPIADTLAIPMQRHVDRREAVD